MSKDHQVSQVSQESEVKAYLAPLVIQESEDRKEIKDRLELLFQVLLVDLDHKVSKALQDRQDLQEYQTGLKTASQGPLVFQA